MTEGKFTSLWGPKCCGIQPLTANRICVSVHFCYLSRDRLEQPLVKNCLKLHRAILKKIPREKQSEMTLGWETVRKHIEKICKNNQTCTKINQNHLFGDLSVVIHTFFGIFRHLQSMPLGKSPPGTTRRGHATRLVFFPLQWSPKSVSSTLFWSARVSWHGARCTSSIKRP